MRFELRHIRAFVVLAEELHFRKAAERLYMTQPGLTRLIKWLEEEVGTPLFTRTTRSVSLTDAGKEFFAECRDVIKCLERGVRRAHHAAAGHVGTLRLAYMDFAINGPLPRILRTFHERFPGVHVELDYMPTAQQKAALLSDQIDIGLMIGPFASRLVRTLSVNREALVVLLPEFHALAAQQTVELTDLRGQRFVMGNATGWSTFRATVLDFCHQAGFAPNIVQEASTSDGIFGLVAANSGVSIYTECANDICRRGVVVRPLTNCNLKIETLAGWRHDLCSPSAGHFLELLEQLLAEGSADVLATSDSPRGAADVIG